MVETLVNSFSRSANIKDDGKTAAKKQDTQKGLGEHLHYL